MILCTRCLSNFKDRLLERKECPICGGKDLKHYDFHIDFVDFTEPFKDEICDIYSMLLEAPHNVPFNELIKGKLQWIRKELNYNAKYYNMFLDEYHNNFNKIIYNICLNHFFDLLSSDLEFDEEKYYKALTSSNIQYLVNESWKLKDLMQILDVLGGFKTIDDIIK